MNELTSLSTEILVTLDTNDRTTLKESVDDVSRRLHVVSEVAERCEESFLCIAAAWKDFQVCTYSFRISVSDQYLLVACVNSLWKKLI